MCSSQAHAGICSDGVDTSLTHNGLKSFLKLHFNPQIYFQKISITRDISKTSREITSSVSGCDLFKFWWFHELFGPIVLHVDVLSLPSQLRVDKRWSYSELLAPSYSDKEKKKGMGRKYMGARILFIASYHTALPQRQAPVWEPNLVGHTVSGLLNFISYPR